MNLPPHLQPYDLDNVDALSDENLAEVDVWDLEAVRHRTTEVRDEAVRRLGLDHPLALRAEAVRRRVAREHDRRIEHVFPSGDDCG